MGFGMGFDMFRKRIIPPAYHPPLVYEIISQNSKKESALDRISEAGYNKDRKGRCGKRLARN